MTLPILPPLFQENDEIRSGGGVVCSDTSDDARSAADEMRQQEEVAGIKPLDLLEAKDSLIVETCDMLRVPLFTAEVLLRNHGKRATIRFVIIILSVGLWALGRFCLFSHIAADLLGIKLLY